MITHIQVKNFKAWKDSGKVALAPLTGFFGTNSSGKSSLLQMLLLLKQTIGTKEVIFFGDENTYVNLGNFQEVIHGHKDEELLELGFACKFPESITIRISQYGLKSDEVTFDSFNFETVIQRYGNSETVSRICYDLDGGVKKIKLEGNDILYQGKRIFTGSYKNCYSIEETTNAFPGSNDFLNLLSSKFEELFSHVYYLAPTRVDPQWHYSWQGRHPEHIKQWGDHLIDALLSARVRRLKTLHGKEEIPIEERISHWLQEMDLAHSFSLNWIEGLQSSTTYEVRAQKTPSSPLVTLVNMGYGLSQFLPVLILCYYVPEGSMLILEEPSTHLHPKVQSQLADLLIEVVTERNLQILVESHSEHLLTRLQRRIAEEKIAADQTALYFCRDDEGVSNIDRLKMDEFGNITNWPPKFFGDEMGDLLAMTKAQRERQKKAES